VSKIPGSTNGVSKGTFLYNLPETREKIAMLERQRDMRHVRKIDRLIPIALERTAIKLLEVKPGLRFNHYSAIYHEEMDKLKRAEGLIA